MSKNHNSVAGRPGHDPTLPDVEIVFGDKTYHLAYDFNAIVMAEKATGVNLLSSVVGKIDATSLRGLLFAALLKDEPDLTLEEVGSFIRPNNIATIRQAIVTAWFGSAKDDESRGEVEETPKE